jgi:hypothetical protein
MAQDFILVGGVENDGTGDSLRVASARINNNFDELYARPSVLSDIETIDNTIKSAASNADIVLKPGGTGRVLFGDGIIIDDNNIKASRSNDDIRFIPSGGGNTVIGAVGFSAGTSIVAKDSSSININENLILDGSLTVTGGVAFSTAITAATGSSFGTLTLADGSITDSSGAISFGNENLTTTGTVTLGTGSTFGNLTVANGSITDSSGAISFGNENLSTTGTLGAGASALSSLTVTGTTALVGATTIDNITFNDNIISTSSNADLRLEPGGTGSVVISNLTLDSNINITDNEIKATASNSDLVLNAAGTGNIFLGAIKIRGTTLSSDDSTFISINDALVIDGVATIKSGVTLDSTLEVSSAISVTGNLIVGGTGSLPSPIVVDNLTLNDTDITSSSNADINVTPGGTGTVDISNLTIDTNLNFTDNEITLSSSNSDFILLPSGTGSVNVTNIDMNSGTVDNTVIGGETPAAGTFSSITLSPQATASLSSSGVTITDNTISASQSNDNLEFAASGTGNIIINGFTLPNADGSTGQVLKTDGSKTLSFVTSPITFSDSNLVDAQTTLSFRTQTEIDHVTARGGHELLVSASNTVDTFATSKYDSALYYALHRDDVSDEFEVAKHSVVHNNSSAFIASYATIRSGTNNHVLFDADVSDGNVRLRGAGLSTANSVSYYRIGLGDDDSTGYTGEQEVSFKITSDIGHNVETVVDHVISTKKNNLLTSTTSSLDEFATTKYDSAFYLAINRDDNSDELEVVKHSLCHNNSSAFVSTYSLAKTGTNNHIVTTADVDSSQVRLLGTASSPNASHAFYRIGLGDNDSTGYSGEQEVGIRINTDLDSATETIDSFAHANFRGAKYYISVNNASKTEVSNLECVVVHDGSAAYITSFGGVDTGSNPLISVTADISGSNVRLRATGNEPNLRVHMYRILLADDEADRTGTNVKVIGEVTVSSSLTTLDQFDNVGADGSTAVDGAHYIVVGHNNSEGTASICEAAVVAQGTNAFITQYAMTSTKETDQIILSADHDGSSTVTVKAQSTSGGSTTVNAYRVALARPAGGTTETFDSFSASDFRGAKYFISINDETADELNNIEILVVHDGTDAFMTDYGNVLTGSNDLVTFTTDLTGGQVRLLATVPGGIQNTLRITGYKIALADEEGQRTGTDVSTNSTTAVSSTATTIDTFDTGTHQGAHYVVVAHNASEAASSIREAAVVTEGTNAFVTEYAQTSTKSTGQITLSVAHDGSSTVSLRAASTSGSSTKVSVYRIGLSRGEGSSSAVATLDSNTIASTRSVKYLVQTTNSEDGNFELIEANVTHDGSDAYVSVYGRVGNTSSDLISLSADVDSGNVRLRGTISNVNTHVVNVVKRTINV